MREIKIVYSEDYLVDEITPKVTGKTTLYNPDGKGEIIVDETDGKGKIIIHHYIYDEKTDTYTTDKLVENEQIKGEIGEEYTTTPSTKIPSNYEVVNDKPEGYAGKYTIETIKINYYYKLKTPKTDSEIETDIISGGEQDENGKWKIKAGEEIKYKVSYKTKIQDYKGKVRIEITAKLPEGTEIDVRKCKLEGGTYNKETNTITWVRDIEEIDTYAETHENSNPDVLITHNTPLTTQIDITKEITIVYAKDYVLDDINLKVTGKTILYYPEGYLGGDGDGDENGNGTLTEDETTEGGKITIHHYIYDEEEGEYTTTKLVPDEQIKGKLGQEYTTTKSSKIPANYEVVNETPVGYEGTIEKEAKEVIYYYKLKTPKVEGNADTNIKTEIEKDEEGNNIIKAGEKVEYEITYETKIDDYIGKASIEITAELPEGTKIDEDKCDFAGGTYDETTNTITWTKEIEEIDTFANGPYEEKITKEITIVYAEDYVLKDANLKVTGKTILYYPEGYPIEKDKPLVKDETKEPEKPAETEKGKIIIHHYIYDAEDNKYLNVKLVEDEEIEKEIGEEYETKASDKIPSNYECINKQPEGYKGLIEKETKEISYYYKIKTPKTEGTGNSNIKTELDKDENGNYIIKKGEEVEYEVEYKVKIDDYKGKATVEIKAELPEGTKIDEDKCDFDGGTYDEETNTITWIKEIEEIDTFANGPYEETITKQITIVYAEDYVLKDLGLKITGNIITYYPDDYPEKGGQTLANDNKNNNPGNNPDDNPNDNPNDNPEEKTGKVIVKYVDIDTDQGSYQYEITGKIGEPYETEEKEIQYYVLVRTTENTKGEITEETQVVTYYYRKLNFNIGIEKTIDTITLNGQNVKISNKETSKLELKKEDINKTELIVKYNIKVTNKGELGGTAKVAELIPEGYELAYLPEYWTVMRDGTLETNVDLEAGESKNLDVVLRWENEENNLGAKTNIAKIAETKNDASFIDTDEKDNFGEATIVLSIKTGEVVSAIIIVMIMGSLGICSYITIRTVRRKAPELKDIKFLK